MPALAPYQVHRAKKAKVDFFDLSVHTSDRQNFSFSDPLSAAKPISHFLPSRLSPTPISNEQLSAPPVKPPFNTTISKMSREGAIIHLHSTHYDLQSADLLSWDCSTLQMLQDPLSPLATWSYLDRLASSPQTSFKRNEIANIFAKWASYAIFPTSLHPPEKKHHHSALSTASQNLTKIVFTHPAPTCIHRHPPA